MVSSENSNFKRLPWQRDRKEPGVSTLKIVCFHVAALPGFDFVVEPESEYPFFSFSDSLKIFERKTKAWLNLKQIRGKTKCRYANVFHT